MPQCHKSIYSCSLIRLNTTLTNEGTFVCDVIEAQWMHWSDLYIKLCLIYFTKDWTKFYLKNLFTLARILNDVELLPSVYKVLNFASICRIARCITFCVKRVLNSLIFRLYRECVKCCVVLCCVVLCCVVLVFYGPSTLFRSFRARSVNLSTLYLGKPPRQSTST